MIAIDDATFFVDNHDSIRVAVQRDPDICSHLLDLADEVLRRGRPAVLIDVEAVGLDTDFDDFGSELPKRFGSNFVGSPICAVDDRANSIEAQIPRQCPLGELDVALPGAFNAGRAADPIGRCQ